MGEKLISVGLDVGTTTTQLVVSRLTVENRASSFTVPDMEITGREIIYRGQVHFTPLVEGELVDGPGIRAIVEREYANAGITRQQVDTGAVIITGETSRKENAAAVLAALSDFAGDFVVATAGPHLESVLAAKGAGAVEFSEKTGNRVLHIDIGGGTSNLALVENGKILQTGCLNVGGRLIRLDENGAVSYLSPVLKGLTQLQLGQIPQPRQLQEVVQLLTAALEMAAGLAPPTALLDRLMTREIQTPWEIPAPGAVISFSGGVADCIDKHPGKDFGDIGPALGAEIRKSCLCSAQYRLGSETIRATVIGAGSHSAKLSGSTVFHRGISLPVKNLPAVVLTRQEQTQPEQIRKKLLQTDAQTVVLAMPGYTAPTYEQVNALADVLLQVMGERPLYFCLEGDMAKALGTAIGLKTAAPCLCIDRIQLHPGDYLDMGQPVGPCLPVVIKTLVLERRSV